METYLVAVEGSNFGTTIWDTEDLSTIRGASLLLNEAVAGLSNVIAGLNPITIGGSSGIWEFESADNKSAVHTLERVEGHLGSNPTAELSFTTALVRVDRSKPFLIQKTILRQIIRRRQLERITGSFPTECGSKLCSVDLIRPLGEAEIWVKGQRRAVSTSVAVRRKVGVEGKQKHIKELGDRANGHIRRLIDEDAKNAPFALLLPSISEQAAPPAALRQNLHDKIAVLHIDGNGFGAAQERYIGVESDFGCGTERQRSFDGKLAMMRNDLVEALFSVLEVGKGYGMPAPDEVELRRDRNLEFGTSAKLRTDQIVRMEMLLCGGDELTFIVPARLGWKVAMAFAAVIEDRWKFDEQPVSAAIGLVYCHHDAPIARIRDLADRLASTLKEHVGRDVTRIFPVVLESFDHIGDGIEAFLDRRLHRLDAVKRQAFFALGNAETVALQNLADQLAADSLFSRSRLRGLAQAAYDGRSYREGTSMLRHLEDKCGEALLGLVGPDELHRQRRWMLLEEFWDYLVPCPTPLSTLEASGDGDNA